MPLTLKFQAARVSPDGELCLKVENVPAARQFVLDMKNRTFCAELKEWRESRSKDANAYMWVLCEKLARATRQEKTDIYRDAIEAVGVYKDFHALRPDDAKTLMAAWRRQGVGWIAEQVDFEPDGEHVIVRCYYGSSVYNTKQMSRLIDNIVQDCEAVGIETLTPLELERLKDEWRAQL